MSKVKNVTPEVLRDLMGKVQELPEDYLREVSDFVDFLRSHQLQQSNRGSPEAVLRHVDTWSFAPGELDRLLADIQEMREMEFDR